MPSCSHPQQIEVTKVGASTPEPRQELERTLLGADRGEGDAVVATRLDATERRVERRPTGQLALARTVGTDRVEIAGADEGDRTTVCGEGRFGVEGTLGDLVEVSGLDGEEAAFDFAADRRRFGIDDGARRCRQSRGRRDGEREQGDG